MMWNWPDYAMHGGVPPFEPAEPKPTPPPPSVTYEAPCDVCGAMSEWRTVLVASNVQETTCDCACEVAA